MGGIFRVISFYCLRRRRSWTSEYTNGLDECVGRLNHLKLSENFNGLEIRYGTFSGLNFGPGIFFGGGVV